MIRRFSKNRAYGGLLFVCPGLPGFIFVLHLYAFYFTMSKS